MQVTFKKNNQKLILILKKEVMDEINSLPSEEDAWENLAKDLYQRKIEEIFKLLNSYFVKLTLLSIFHILQKKVMSRRTQKLFNLFFLSVFLVVTLFINFFHTEKNFARDDNCPACNFQRSSLTTTQINFFHLPPPAIFTILKTFESFNYTCIFFIDPSSRSPPEI